MANNQAPTPPAGTRWREYKGVTYIDGSYWRNGRQHASAALCIAFNHNELVDDDFPALDDLRITPTEPLPAPAVDRESTVWEILWLALREAPGFNDEMKFADAADQTFLALAPHWREIKALAGEATETPQRGIGITDAHIEAGIRAYSETSAYWAPEVMHSPGHVRKLVERILAVVEDAS